MFAERLRTEAQHEYWLVEHHPAHSSDSWQILPPSDSVFHASKLQQLARNYHYRGQDSLFLMRLGRAYGLPAGQVLRLSLRHGPRQSAVSTAYSLRYETP